jgi:HEPN domain-containing protein
MATPRSKEPRKFYRAAARRLEEAQFLLDKGGYTTAAVYLAGYAVECMLKALILSSEPATRHAATLHTFRGAAAHAFEWLVERLAERHVRLPADIRKELSRVDWWTTTLRYDPGAVKQRDAGAFLAAAGRIVLWAKGRL